MKNAMQLKALVRNKAAKWGISAQLVLQNLMLERLLERVSQTRYREHFILKGGFLLASIIGLHSRATMDMDATLKGMPLTRASLREMFAEVCAIDLADNITFEFLNIGEIREDDQYAGYRVSVYAHFPPLAVPLKLDITTGDAITPEAVEFQYRLMMEERSISVMAYNAETLLAEKLETIISRGTLNTRPRDFYDVYALQKYKDGEINRSLLAQALAATVAHRSSAKLIEQYSAIMDEVSESEVMQQRWIEYSRSFGYAHGIPFTDVCSAVRHFLA